MNQFNLKLFLCSLVFTMLFSTGAFAQGSTTGNITGKVIDTKKEEVIAANVVATHVPTGTRYGTTTGIDGNYFIPNMRVGGPYTVVVSYVGYQETTENNVYIKLGQTYRKDFSVSESELVLGAVVVTGNKMTSNQKTGAETRISEDMIAALPTVSRAIGDFARLTPQANVREGNDGFSISLGGINNRYNAIYIDGAVNNDVFGLSGSGTNGGQTGVSPFSVDAIEEFQISLAPFDVRIGGFAGGAISAVTRSGTNEIKGSAYYYFRNENLAGKTPTDNEAVDRKKLNEFTATTYGFRLGGPILKNKVFFFVNAELQRDAIPAPFDFANYSGSSTEADLGRLTSKLNGFGYDPGLYDASETFLDSEKITAKLDFNISDIHKLSLKHSYVHGENQEGVTSASRNIRYLNSSEFFDTKTNSTSLELNSIFNSKISNSLIIGVTSVTDDRDPSGDPFPYVEIRDGAGTISFGSERFSTANLLNQRTITVTDNLTFYKNEHTFTIGTHNEFYKMENLFIASNYGFYRYNNLDDFLNDEVPARFERGYSLRDNVSGDDSKAISSFTGAQVGIYAQDEYAITPEIRLTAGIRLDVPIFANTPVNESFNTNTIPLIESFGYDLRGARVGDFIKPTVNISPRFGFNYDVNGNQTTIFRGGLGVFTSRVPLVWPGGAYNNFGLNIGFQPFTNDPFNPDINAQPPGDIDVNNVEPNGQIDLFAEDFKTPQVAKLNLAVDHQLPGGITAGLDFLYNKTLNNVAFQNLNLKPATERLTGTGDSRPYFNRSDRIDRDYQRIILAYNTKAGYSYNITASLNKQFKKNAFASLAYSYGDAYSKFDGTSSQNSSQWRGIYAVNGRNFDQQLTRSGFSAGHRVIGTLSKKFNWNKGKNVATTITLFYEGISGQPFTYQYNDFGGLNNEDSRDRSLFYVPMDQNDINLVDIEDDGVVVATAAQQWTDLNAFIENSDHLSSRRGKYAEVNAERAPWANVMDLKVLQDFSVYVGGKKQTFQLSLDMFNFTNLINKDWGRRYFVPSNYRLVNFQGFQSGTRTPEFTFPGVTDNDPSAGNIDDQGIQSSRWQMQLGLRYIFN